MFLILNMKSEKIVENIMQEEKISRRDFFKKAAGIVFNDYEKMITKALLLKEQCHMKIFCRKAV
jgi:hypothetical protein